MKSLKFRNFRGLCVLDAQPTGGPPNPLPQIELCPLTSIPGPATDNVLLYIRHDIKFLYLERPTRLADHSFVTDTCILVPLSVYITQSTNRRTIKSLYSKI
jgi:hypothetical protein